jgi:hypothetical protein
VVFGDHCDCYSFDPRLADEVFDLVLAAVEGAFPVLSVEEEAFEVAEAVEDESATLPEKRACRSPEGTGGGGEASSRPATVGSAPDSHPGAG